MRSQLHQHLKRREDPGVESRETTVQMVDDQQFSVIFKMADVSVDGKFRRTIYLENNTRLNKSCFIVFKVARRGLDIPVFGILLQLHQ